jgi:hypothetical protein
MQEKFLFSKHLKRGKSVKIMALQPQADSIAVWLLCAFVCLLQEQALF